jgi:hypothetical protein
VKSEVGGFTEKSSDFLPPKWSMNSGTGIGVNQRIFHPRTANTRLLITVTVAVRGKKGINGESAISWTWNPPEEEYGSGGITMQFIVEESSGRILRKLPAQGRGIHRRNGIPPEINSS